MKRIALILASLGFCTATLAASSLNAASPSEITIPQLPGGFSIGGTLLFLQPSITNGDLDYASDQEFTGAAFQSTLINSNVKQVEPGYDFGWGINVGYEFPQTGNDINLSYQHLDTNAEDSALNRNNLLFPVGILFPSNTQPSAFQFASAKADVALNRVDLTAGQMIDMGNRLQVHPNAGISYVDLKRTLDSTFYSIAPQTQPTSNSIQSNTDHSHFWGVGPMAGLDANYYLGAGLGLVAHGQGGLLVGDLNDKENTNYQSINTPGFSPSTLHFDTNTNFRMVPTYTAKAGMDFTYDFKNSAASYLTAEAGFQISEYFSAVDSIKATTIIVGHGNDGNSTVSVAALAASRKTANLYLDGPYASITVHL